MDNIWVYVDQFKGTALPASWEAVGAGRRLAGELGGGVTALVFGSGVEAIAKEAFHYGAEAVTLCDDPTLTDFRVEPYAALLARLAAEGKPQAILGPATTRVRDAFGMAAVDLETGAIADATGVEVKDGALLVTRPVYAGKLMSKVVCAERRPQIITLRSRAFPMPEPDTSRTGEITQAAPVMAEAVIATKVVDYAVEAGRVSLADAKIIVSGGRGVSNNPSLTPPADVTDEKQKEIWRAQQGFELVRELAATLGAAVGASRAAVDAGYIPYANQVGQTGKTVSPDVYVACGISGAIQHQAGMRTAKLIVAINKDAEAPIFRLARYGVVGDLFQILPALTAEFKQRLGR